MTVLTRVAALGLLVVCLALTAGGLASLLLPGSDQIPDRPSFLDVLIGAIVLMTFSTVGTTVAWKRPSNGTGWLFLLVGVAFAIATFGSEYAGRAAFSGATFPAADIVGWAGGWSWVIAAGLALPVSIMLFPDGRLPGPRWRRVVGAVIVAVIVITVASAVVPGDLEGYAGRLRNPFGIGGPVGELAAAIQPLGTLGLVVTAILAVASLIVRFRRSHGPEHQQIKWLVYPASLFLVGLIGAAATQDTAAWSLALFGFGAVPIGVGIGILRYRLYDIDLVIRRTLVYGALVAVLGAVYVGLVLALQTVLSELTGGDTLPVALSTLAIAALFGPLRARVRAIIDRRFYRSRYDAQRTLEQLTGRLRDEVELEAVGRTLVEVAGRAVRPSSASVWLRAGPSR